MLERLLAPCAGAVYVILRVVVGLLFAFHGFQMLFGVLTDEQPEVGSQKWLGAIIELVTGTAVAAGAFTTWAAFLASGTMAVAYVQFHWKLQLNANALPAVNKGELALVYSFLFLFIACRGAGGLGVDRWRAGRASNELLATPPLAP